MLLYLVKAVADTSKERKSKGQGTDLKQHREELFYDREERTLLKRVTG